MPSIQPISPSAPLGMKNAAHLLRRTTFGPTKADIDQFSALSITQALNVLFAAQPAAQPPLDLLTGQPWVNPKPTPSNSEESELMKMTFSWWLDLMRTGGNALIDRMAWFFHSHFATISSRPNSGTAIYYQIKLFRHYATGNFKELSLKITYDNAMLVNLDGRLNDIGRPNENFAREFFELHTIGKGQPVGPNDYTTFTEDDVIASSKVLSGYNVDWDFGNIDPVTGVAMGVIRGSGTIATNHDASTKQFSPRFQNTIIKPNVVIDNRATKEATLDELNQLVTMIFNQEATARHICRKLYRFFVYYNITEEVERDIIEPLALTFLQSDYELLPVLEQLFRSTHFFDADNGVVTDDNRGAIIKSPMEVILGSLRFFNITWPDQTSNLEGFYAAWYNMTFEKMRDQGLDFYEPYDVSGYDGYYQEPAYNRNWITPNNLARRYQISSDLLLGFKDESDNELYRLDILKYCQNNAVDLNSPQAIVTYFVTYLLPEQITTERFDYFKSALLIDVDEANWVSAVINVEDFQVIFHLESLINAIMQSPEYQLF